MSMVERWVGDRLHDILGISEKYIAQYLISLAEKSSSSQEFVQKLKDTGTVEVDTNMANFCNELWNKVNCLYDSTVQAATQMPFVRGEWSQQHNWHSLCQRESPFTPETNCHSSRIEQMNSH